MPDIEEFGKCPHCGRTDVPICSQCKCRVPHGFIVGTSLPCNCKEVQCQTK